MKTNDGQLVVIGGASRSGKTIWTSRAVAGDQRVFAWDPEDQWSGLRGWKKATTRGQLLAATQAPGPQKVAYVAGGNLAQEFGYWAGCVMYAGRYVGPLTAIAEELADVTTPAKAPGNWGILLRRGLKRGISIYAISQRWQEADKTALGNASTFVLFRQNGAAAGKYLERMTGVPAAEIPTDKLDFIVYDPTSGKIFRDRLKF